MALFALICTDKPDSLALRMATREAHFAYARVHAGAIRLGGPFLTADGGMAGSLTCWRRRIWPPPRRSAPPTPTPWPVSSRASISARGR